MPDLGRYSKPDGPIPNWSELLPMGKIDEARDAQVEACGMLVEDINFVADAMIEAGADGIDMDTTGAAGDADFLAALTACRKLREKYPWLGIEIGMASEFVLGMHGQAEFDGSRLAGMWPKEQLRMVTEAGASIYGPAVNMGIVAGLDIPAGVPRVVFKDELTLPIDVTAVGARGHAHELGRDLKLTARLPNGSVRGLLWIDRWDTRWQQSYYFTGPIKLPKGTKIQVEITYDNSPANPRNPSSPPRRVVWGPRLERGSGGDGSDHRNAVTADAALLATARTARFREQLLKTIAK